jgi:uncharacterized membrane protein YqiK
VSLLPLTKKEYNKKYYEEHKAKRQADALRWYEENKDKLDKTKLKEYHVAYYEAHRDTWPRRTREQQDQYNATRREKYATDDTYRETQKQTVKEYWQANPRVRKNQRLRQYKISIEEYEKMLDAHGHKCAICGYSDKSQPKFFPMVDHDHESGKVRGILCSNCNMAIGKMKDNPELLKRAAEYLERGGFFNGEMANLV